MTATAPTIDETVLEALDFEPTVPCDHPQHATGAAGCEPAEPARWRVIMLHFKPGCQPDPHTWCDGLLVRTRADLERLLHMPCPCGSGHPALNLCAMCGAELRSVDDLLVVIGEV